MLEPAFDIYLDQIKLAGGESQFVPLRVATNDDGTQRTRSAPPTFAPCLQARLTVLPSPPPFGRLDIGPR